MRYLLIRNVEVFQDLGPYHIETNLICKGNKWTGFYIIVTTVMKELRLLATEIYKSVTVRKQYFMEDYFQFKRISYKDVILFLLFNSFPSFSYFTHFRAISVLL